MNAGKYQHVYGPVPSRRLGRSLGIDLVPLKTCTYDCVYCQLGRTTCKTCARRQYTPVAEVLAELKEKLAGDDQPDYISLAGSGEPTLNCGIGNLITGIKALTQIPVAVVTNGSLLWMREVQDELMAADLVLPSLDAGDDRLFQHINRPCAQLSFEQMVEGIAEFTGRFKGEVWLEVMLLGGLNGLPAAAQKIATLAARMAPARVQLNTVHRPPAEPFAFALSTEQLLALKGLFPGRVEIIGQQAPVDVHNSTGADITTESILALLGRRPCTPADVACGLGVHIAQALKHLEGLRSAGRVETVIADGRCFYAANCVSHSAVTRQHNQQIDL